jgi:hypothetical protein
VYQILPRCLVLFTQNSFGGDLDGLSLRRSGADGERGRDRSNADGFQECHGSSFRNPALT